MKPGLRDAQHVPFIVVQCRYLMSPGTKVIIRENVGYEASETSCDVWDRDSTEIWHGVADPFCEQMIPPDRPFRVYLRPEVFANVRHTFDLIDIPAAPARDFLREVEDDKGCHAVCNEPEFYDEPYED